MLFISKSERLRFGIQAGFDHMYIDPITGQQQKLNKVESITIEFQRDLVTNHRALLDALNYFYPLKNGMIRAPLGNETVLPELQGGIIDGSISAASGMYEGSDPTARFSGYDTANVKCCPENLRETVEDKLQAYEGLGHYYFLWTPQAMAELLPWPGYTDIKGPQSAEKIAELVPVVAGTAEKSQMEMWDLIRQYESSRPKLRPSVLERAGAEQEKLRGPVEVEAAFGLPDLAAQIAAQATGQELDEDEPELTAASGRYGKGHPESNG